MRFEWDPSKNAENIHKHRVSFEVAHRVFYDPVHLEADATEDEYDEVRWKAVGRPDLARSIVLLVIATERAFDTLRIISARKADPEDVQDYYDQYDQP